MSSALDSLPPHLAERVHAPSLIGDPSPQGTFVLYWLRTGARATENPALDVAIHLGAALGIPVFVYHALSERYPFASDRHHMFILEGARDLASQLCDRGIGTAFHLERDGHRGPHLRTLAEQSALVVTEYMPVAPLTRWTSALRESLSVPVWEVDTACVVPMRLVTKAYDRAFAYRDATATLRRERIARPWVDAPVRTKPFLPLLPFEPVDLATTDLAALVASCRIDHSVGPVPETRGGSRAGYARWAAFVDSGRIDRYDRTRNEPTRGDGVSRMSAYLHYGMVSPFRLARDAHARSSEGAKKWLDELMIWRELAYTFCSHRPDHGTTDALPAWAQETLRAHERDTRTLYAWEELARGRTQDAFWNAMQQSLLAHGELHNNVRMTWGKAFAGWTPDAASALTASIDLNHRYALDGRDPASYGGLLWCLGQFDRPFTPPNAALGSVRGRATVDQAQRISVDRYHKHVSRSVYAQPRRVAVIGAGLSGLICARTLSDHNVSTRVFEKSRGYGGRCATRQYAAWRFDHGAQYFTVRDARLQPRIRSWQQEGVIAPWQGKLAVRDAGEWTDAKTGVRRWVGVPGMNALGAHLAADLDVSLNTEVAHIQREGTQWRLVGETGADLGTYDVVLTCIPAPQAHTLLAPVAPALAEATTAAVMHTTWATMLVLAERPTFAYDGAFVNDDPTLSWISRNASKPGRGPEESWILHGTRAFSEARFGGDADMVADEMTTAFGQLLGAPVRAMHAVGHCWRYALPDPVASDAALYDAASGLGAAGDWCGGPRIEGALLSGIALAGRILTNAHVAMHSTGA